MEFYTLYAPYSTLYKQITPAGGPAGVSYLLIMNRINPRTEGLKGRDTTSYLATYSALRLCVSPLGESVAYSLNKAVDK